MCMQNSKFIIHDSRIRTSYWFKFFFFLVLHKVSKYRKSERRIKASILIFYVCLFTLKWKSMEHNIIKNLLTNRHDRRLFLFFVFFWERYKEPYSEKSKKRQTNKSITQEVKQKQEKQAHQNILHILAPTIIPFDLLKVIPNWNSIK